MAAGGAGNVDVVMFEVRRVKNAISKLEESNAELQAELDDAFDQDFADAIAENNAVIAGMHAKVAELEALVGVAPAGSGQRCDEGGAAGGPSSVAAGAGGGGSGDGGQSASGPEMDDDGGVFL